MKEISKTLKDFLVEEGLNCEWQTTEHDGCWDKGCSHPGRDELNVWHGDNRTFSWSFAEGCTDWMIMTTLKDRVTKASWIKLK